MRRHSHWDGPPSAARRSEKRIRFPELVRRVVSNSCSKFGGHEVCADVQNRPAVGCVHQKVSGRNGDTGEPSLDCSTRCAFTSHQLLSGLLLRGRTALPSIGTTYVVHGESRQNRIVPNDPSSMSEAPSHGVHRHKAQSRCIAGHKARPGCVFEDKSLDKCPHGLIIPLYN